MKNCGGQCNRFQEKVQNYEMEKTGLTACLLYPSTSSPRLPLIIFFFYGCIFIPHKNPWS